MTVSDCARAALVLLVLAASAVMARDIEVSSEVSSESDPMCTTTPPYFVNLQTKKAISTPFLRWTEFGPGMSGYSDKFFVHPSNPNTMHVAMDMGNSYYTHDNGLSWTTIKDWDSDAEDHRTEAIDFSRQTPTFGLGLADKGLLMNTTDGGATFTVMGESAPAPHQTGTITVDPKNDSNWYVGSGQFWRVKDIHRSSANLTGTQEVNTDYGHIFVSKNRGQTWTTIQFDPLLDVAKIFVDPEMSEVVYAVTNLGFYKSINGGFTWIKSGVGLPWNQPRDGDMFHDPATKEVTLYLVEQTHFDPDPKNPKTVRGTGGVFQSLDRGETWLPIIGNLEIDMTQIHQDLATDAYFRTLAYWFNTSTDDARLRFPDMPTSTMTVYNRVVASKTQKGTLFLVCNVKHDFSFGPGEIMRSTDSGATWIAVARNGIYWVNETDKAYWQSRNNPLGMNMKYAHLDFEMRTTDMDAGVRTLVSKPDGDLILIHEQQTLRSKDHGDSWAQIDDDETVPGNGHWVGRGGSNLPGVTMLMDTGRPEYLFTSGEHGLWRGTSDGDSVIKYGVAVEQLTGESKAIYGATSVCSVAVHPSNPDEIYIQQFRQSFRGEVRKSVDGGVTWTSISYPIKSQSALSPNMILQKDLMLSKSNPATMFFTVPFTVYVPYTPTLWMRNGPSDFNDFGVYRSKDGGVSWQWLNNSGLAPGCSVARLEMDPNNSLVIYAALNVVNIPNVPRSSGGLYRTADGGDTWHSVAIPFGIAGVNHVSVDRSTGAVYIAAGEAHGNASAGGVWRRAHQNAPWEKLFFMPYVLECYPSPANPNMLVASVGIGHQIGSLNPGVYYSKDLGVSWTKANYRLGQPGRIMAIRPDLTDENVLFVALFGSGWFKGVILPTAVRAFAPNLYLRSGDARAQLDGTASIGPSLSYMWTGPASNPTLSSTTDAAPTFTAPTIAAGLEIELKYNLTVSSPSSGTDTIEVRVVVRHH